MSHTAEFDYRNVPNAAELGFNRSGVEGQAIPNDACVVGTVPCTAMYIFVALCVGLAVSVPVAFWAKAHIIARLLDAWRHRPRKSSEDIDPDTDDECPTASVDVAPEVAPSAPEQVPDAAINSNLAGDEL